MRIGIDLGGTKISGVLMNDAGEVETHLRRESPRGDYGATLNAIRELSNDLAGPDRRDLPIGIGIPGTVSGTTGLVKNANSTWLIGKPLDQDIESLTGRPVRVANDADCFTLSEAVDGAGQGFSTIFGVILGTGVGGGLAVNGKLIRGPNGIAGEWGHNPLPWRNPATDPMHGCYCGKDGCIETFLSGPGLSAHHRSDTGEDLTAESIAAGEKPSRVASLARYSDRLARALAHVINVFDPEAIVLGGGLSQIKGLYDSVPARWSRYVFSDSVETKLLRNRHGTDSGVRGAAWLWPGMTDRK
ncbi:MAG: ROK family protein [Alphaproteobacteria bacterium]|nr:ROK family protein [Alphaproteobacteria bacterium]